MTADEQLPRPPPVDPPKSFISCNYGSAVCLDVSMVRYPDYITTGALAAAEKSSDGPR